jgi:glycerol-3-phosphate dehydrogenase
MSDKFRVYTSKDVKGVELGGAVKNIIALCAQEFQTDWVSVIIQKLRL